MGKLGLCAEQVVAKLWQIEVLMAQAPHLTAVGLALSIPSYGAVFKRRLNSLGIRDNPTAPRSLWQNSYAERTIDSIGRECLDHNIIFGEAR